MSALGKPSESPMESPPLTFRSKSIGQQSGIGIKNQMKALRIQKMPSCSEMRTNPVGGFRNIGYFLSIYSKNKLKN